MMLSSNQVLQISGDLKIENMLKTTLDYCLQDYVIKLIMKVHIV